MSNPKYVNFGHPAIRLMEECAEAIMAVSKGLRFGWGNYHPDGIKDDNLTELGKEIKDINRAFLDLKIRLRKKNING